MMKEVRTFVNEQTYNLMNEKAERCGLSVPEIAAELLIIGVGA